MSPLAGVSLSPFVHPPRWARVLIAAVLFLTIFAGVWYVKAERDRERWMRVLGKVPGALARVPLPLPGELPVVRFRAACALLGKEMDLPAATVEEELAKLAQEVKHVGRAIGRAEERGAILTVSYLDRDPFAPNTLRMREYAGAGEDLAEEEAELRAVIIHRRNQKSEAADEARTLYRLALCLWHQHRDAEAEAVQRESLALLDPPGAPEDADSRRFDRFFLTCILHRQQKYADEEAELRGLVTSAEHAPSAGERVEAEALNRVRARPQTSARYRAHLEAEAARFGQAAQREQDERLARLRANLAVCLHAQGKDEEAAALARKVLAGVTLRNAKETLQKARQVLEEIGKGKGNSPAPMPPGER